MAFTPQLTKPKKGDPYYNTKASGGFSPCILGNPKRREAGLNTLPNCVGWACGRFNSLGNYGECRYLGNTNAQNFIALAKRQGLTVQTEPTLGGVMVWSGGGYGHVACVEVLTDKNIVITSESEYYGKAFATYARRRGDGNWRSGCYWMSSAYKYLGCIVNPAVKEVPVFTYEQFKEYMARYLAEIAAQPADAWAEGAIEYCKDAGLMVGDADGNFRPQSGVRREELAAVLRGLLIE